MDFAVNYSTQAADLLRQGKIQVDRFKCPDWPEIIIPAQALHPVHVHFSLQAGRWRRPELVTFEYDGVGSIFEAVGSVAVLAEQLPRLYALVKNNTL